MREEICRFQAIARQRHSEFQNHLLNKPTHSSDFRHLRAFCLGIRRSLPNVDAQEWARAEVCPSARCFADTEARREEFLRRVGDFNARHASGKSSAGAAG